jgi:hypothetical protein
VQKGDDGCGIKEMEVGSLSHSAKRKEMFFVLSEEDE